MKKADAVIDVVADSDSEEEESFAAIDDVQLSALKEVASSQTIHLGLNSEGKVSTHDVAGILTVTKEYQGQRTKEEGSNTQAGLCVICEKPLPKPIETQTVLVKGIKPRFLREIKRIYPLKAFRHQDRICIKDVHAVMQARIEQLMETDQSELAKLQDNAMKNLGEYEIQEQTWQKQFALRWTLGEKAADLVARFGGSWSFIGWLMAVLLAWAIANILMSQPWSKVQAWDPYPFILLNLFLSMLAGLQAPIIMMSQNRQGQLDRLQNDYISKIILRAEHQVRHVNAKLDHLLGHQWKRLLEIQEIQIDLLQTLQSQNRRMSVTASERPNMLGRPTSIPSARHSFWSCETHPDHHVHMLLAHHFGSPKSSTDDTMFFAHWHTDGDNFMGRVENIRFEVRSPGVIKRITYDLSFKNDSCATLDDIFAGEGTVTLRNDLDVKSMTLRGRILRVEIHTKDKTPVSFANGDLPSRYKSTFFLKRSDKITDFWKTPITRVNLTYSPPHQAAILQLKHGQTVSKLRVDFFPTPGLTKALLKMQKTCQEYLPHTSGGFGNVGHPEKTPISRQNQLTSYMEDIIGPRPLPEEAWKTVAHAIWPANSIPSTETSEYSSSIIGALVPPLNLGAQQSGGTGSGGGDISVMLETGSGRDVVMTEALPVTVYLDEVLRGPCVYVFLCDETRVAFNANINE